MSRFDEFRRRINATYTAESLTALGYAVPEAHAAGELSDEELAALVALGKARRAVFDDAAFMKKVAELAAAIAPAPPPHSFDPLDLPFGETAELGERALDICDRLAQAPDDYIAGLVFLEAARGPELTEAEEQAITRAFQRRAAELRSAARAQIGAW